MNINKENKPTLILGASAKKDRYAYLVAQRLQDHAHTIYLLGYREGEILGETIHKEPFPIDDLDTITMYLSAKNQIGYYDYIQSLKPKRVIFNPGAENPELAHKLSQMNIEVENACTLVLLSIGEY